MKRKKLERVKIFVDCVGKINIEKNNKKKRNENDECEGHLYNEDGG